MNSESYGYLSKDKKIFTRFNLRWSDSLIENVEMYYCGKGTNKIKPGRENSENVYKLNTFKFKFYEQTL